MTKERLGILLRVVSGLLFTAMVVCVKALSDTTPLGQIVFFRSAVALIPLIVFLWLCGEFPGGLKTARPLGHVLRCALGAVAMFTSFATLRFLPVAEATMLSYLSPVMVVALAALLLGEAVTGRRWAGVALGLAGVGLFTVPEFGGEIARDRLTGVALGLLTALLTAGALIQIRHLAKTESAGAIAFYFAAVSALAGLATLPGGWIAPPPVDLALLVAAGLFGGAAHIAMTVSFRLAEASAMAPFEYLTLIWAVIAGLVLLGEVPGAVFLLAAPLIIGGALVAAPPRSAEAKA